MSERRWTFAIDRGGTFTDVVARSSDGLTRTLKLLSEDPARYADAATEGVRRILTAEGGELAGVRMGTTVATNALLERKGEPCALAITRGFGDALRIGYQARPEIFARHIVLPSQLAEMVVEIDERVDPQGAVLKPLDEEAARRGLAAIRERGIGALAIVLVHGWKHPAHEQRLAATARELGFNEICVSHEVAPLIKLIGRGDTTVVDAYLSPVLRGYVAQVASGLQPGTPLQFMQSNGGLTDARRFRGKDAVLSGPAGGVVGMVETSRPHGSPGEPLRLIGFDMGGTSTDVSHWAGAFELAEESTVAGVRLKAPMMQIHTVAAGGGSVCTFDGMRFRVGPQSAGARPGPACYRNGGPLTVTDCNLFLGRIVAEHFPQVFGATGNLPLSLEAAKGRLVEVQEAVAAELGQSMNLDAIAEGFLSIAVDSMANAIRKISIRRGHDVTRYTLACFGGAGGQHACQVADSLGIRRILIHPLAGLLSAYGIGMAEVKAIREASWLKPLGADFGSLLQDLELQAGAHLAQQGVQVQRLARRARLRVPGSDTALEIAVSHPATMRQQFATLHRQRFGYVVDDEPTVDTLVVEAAGQSAIAFRADEPAAEVRPSNAIAAPDTRTTSSIPPVLQRATLTPAAVVSGPALIVDPAATTFVAPGWQARSETDGMLVLARTEPLQHRPVAGTEVDPVTLEIFNNLFMAIAEDMGSVLEATATSINIKERLDFSCALFDRQGQLIANAPHIPVHLGSMGESIRTILSNRDNSADGRGMRPGDAYVLNDPYHGGTHLPDITVVLPVFSDGGASPFAFVAARGHHADIGGIAPGSMPSHSHSIAEEGVLLNDVLLVDEGRFREADLRERLGSGPHPARNPDQNIADLKAQVAACTRGAEALLATVRDHGAEVVSAYMDHVLAHAAEAVRRLIDRLKPGEFTYEMDNGAQVSVSLRIDCPSRSAVFDFTGTSPQLADNFNAPRSIVRAAALYVIRTLIDDPIPMNDGCLRPITLLVPEPSMLAPRSPAAVVAGNVETSQVITDALFAATGRLAPSQGTMNNFSFGNDRHQYYETIAGGSGAGPDHAGTSAVQTHMTNSRLTDPEVLETRLPVRVDEFSIRHGSGGEGRHCGGDGVIRRITFLEPMQAQILSNRRRIPPSGLCGGGPAAPGLNRVERADGRVEALGGTAAVAMEAGDTFVIATPGGGGYGAPPESGL